MGERWMHTLRRRAERAKERIVRQWLHLVERCRRALGRSDGLECQRCHDRVVPILYGFPSGDGFDLVDRREAVLGGCVMVVVGGEFAGPRKTCRHCGWVPSSDDSFSWTTDLEPAEW
jgi:hypothetical protein